MRTASVLACVATAAIAGSATADFIGAYDHANWTFFTAGGGYVATATPAQLTLIGGDVSISGYTEYTIAAATAGNFEFDWSYYSINSPGYDAGGYIVGGTYYQLDDGYGPGSGSVSVAVTAGETIGFYAFTSDGAFGPGEFTVTNFDVPAPGVLALLGLAGLASRRRR